MLDRSEIIRQIKEDKPELEESKINDFIDYYTPFYNRFVTENHIQPNVLDTAFIHLLLGFLIGDKKRDNYYVFEVDLYVFVDVVMGLMFAQNEQYQDIKKYATQWIQIARVEISKLELEEKEKFIFDSNATALIDMLTQYILFVKKGQNSEGIKDKYIKMVFNMFNKFKGDDLYIELGKLIIPEKFIFLMNQSS